MLSAFHRVNGATNRVLHLCWLHLRSWVGTWQAGSQVVADSDLRKCGIQGKRPMNDNQATTSCFLLDFNLTAYRLFLFLYRSPTLGGRTSYIAKHEVHNEYGGTCILYSLLAGGGN